MALLKDLTQLSKFASLGMMGTWHLRSLGKSEDLWEMEAGMGTSDGKGFLAPRESHDRRL
jgi:hypothetical protein